jgi:hypothetical protein
MPVEVASPIRDQQANENTDLLTQLDQALAEANAPIRSNGPGLLKLGGLIFKEILSPTPRSKSEDPQPPDDSEHK